MGDHLGIPPVVCFCPFAGGIEDREIAAIAGEVLSPVVAELSTVPCSIHVDAYFLQKLHVCFLDGNVRHSYSRLFMRITRL